VAGSCDQLGDERKQRDGIPAVHHHARIIESNPTAAIREPLVSQFW
jgi:hypothetical protein